MKKENILLISGDLDGCFIPAGAIQLIKFAEVLKNIEESFNIKVKLCLISGRPADYVMGIMRMYNDTFKDMGLSSIAEYGSGEQGAVLVDHIDPYKFEILGNQFNNILKKEIGDTIEQAGLSKYFGTQFGTKYTNVYTLRDEYFILLNDNQKNSLYNKFICLVKEKYGDKINLDFNNRYIDVFPKDIGKEKMLKYLIDRYQKKFNIVGITYSGDAVADFKAIEYLLKFSLVPGISRNIIVPSNSSENLISVLRKTKLNRGNIEIGDSQFIGGIIEGLKNLIKKGNLVDIKFKNSKSKDTLDLRELNF